MHRSCIFSPFPKEPYNVEWSNSNLQHVSASIPEAVSVLHTGPKCNAIEKKLNLNMFCETSKTILGASHGLSSGHFGTDEQSAFVLEQIVE